MEHQAQFGALVTDFTLIRTGSLHRANGGYLVMEAMDLLRWFFSYEALKRCLKNGEIRIEDPAEMLGLITTKTLQPQPIPLNIKIILIGDPYIYQLLYIYDEDFHKFFKIKAHFDSRMRKTDEHVQKFCDLVAGYCQDQKLMPLHKTGMARLIEYAGELAGHQDKLTLQLEEVKDTLKEANFWARSNTHDGGFRHRRGKGHPGEDLPGRPAGREAAGIHRRRHALHRDRGRGGGPDERPFGLRPGGPRLRPAQPHHRHRRLGRGGVVAIDRESQLSGNIHNKGVLILAGFLRSRFAQDKPLTLSASLCFEQSYGMVEGDSASMAELVTLLSALAEVPLAQNLAMTGSVSQRGEAQPIGGVNWKIEGFYRFVRPGGWMVPKASLFPRPTFRT